MDVLSNILSTFRLQAEVFHNGQFCGDWQIDTSGSRKATFHIVTHGHCELMFNQGTEHEATLNVGDMVFFPHDGEHRVSSDTNVDVAVNTTQSQSFLNGLQKDGTGLVCGFLEFEHAANNFVFDLLTDAVVIKINEPPWNQNLKPLIDVLISESISDQAGVQATLNRIAESIFSIVVRHRVNLDPASTGFAAALKEPRMYKALEAIHDAPARTWSVEELAEIASMSRSAFSVKFKAMVGETPATYITRWRMQLAYRWLRDERITTAVAADRCGYETEAAFAKAFKRELGVSPGQVRSS